MAWLLSAVVASGPNDAALPTTGSPARPYAPSSGMTIDGVAMSSLTSGTTRVLLLNQGGSPGVAAASNGIWIYKSGTGTANAWSRPTDTGDYVTGATLDNETVVRVSSGTALTHTEHACITQGTITVDTTAIAHSRQLLKANVMDFGAVGTGGVTSDSTAIANAIASVTANNGTVVFPRGEYLLGSSVTFPANVQLVFEQGAVIGSSVSSLQINGPISAHPRQQIFALALLGAVTASGGGPTVTVSGFANAAYSFKVVIQSNGALGAATFSYSLNGGTTYTPASGPYLTVPANGIYVVPGTGGTTINFSAGSYTTSDSYTWSSSTSNAKTILLTSAATDVYPIAWWGAQGNAQQVQTGAMSANSYALTAPATFGTADVGKSIVVVGAGSYGGNLSTTILSVASGLPTLAASAAMSVGGLSAVTALGTSPPDVTVSGTPTGAFQFQIQITTGGSLSSMYFIYTTNGGTTWSSPIAGTASPYTISSTGVTVTFPTGTYTGGGGAPFTQNTYSWTSTWPVLWGNDDSGDAPARHGFAVSTSPKSVLARFASSARMGEVRRAA